MVSANKSRPAKVNKDKLNKHAKVTKSKKIKKIPEIVKKVAPKVENVLVKKQKKNTMPSKYITKDIVDSCLDVLKQLKTNSNKKNTIFDDELPVFAEITPMKIQSTKVNLKFVLPYTTAPSTGEICLITKDLKKGRKHDHEPTVDHWEELLRKAGVTKVKTILPMRQLRVEYDQFELKRRLLTQHDFIMVDTRVISHVSHLLGNMFFKKHNMLIPVRINEAGDLKKDIDVGVRTTMLRLSDGSTSTITVGHIGMETEQLRDNVLSLVEQLKSKYPGGESNIRSITLKLPLSLSLPLYLTLRSSNSVPVPKIKQTKPKQYKDVEDELSTMPGVRVRVAADGTVHVIKDKNHNVDFDEDNSDLEAEEPEVKTQEPEDINDN